MLAGIIYLHPIYEAQGGDFLDNGDLDLVQNICGVNNLLIVLTARGVYPGALFAHMKIHGGRSAHGSTFTLAKQRGAILSDLDFTVKGSIHHILQSLPLFSEPIERDKRNSEAAPHFQRDIEPYIEESERSLEMELEGSRDGEEDLSVSDESGRPMGYNNHSHPPRISTVNPVISSHAEESTGTRLPEVAPKTRSEASQISRSVTGAGEHMGDGPPRICENPGVLQLHHGREPNSLPDSGNSHGATHDIPLDNFQQSQMRPPHEFLAVDQGNRPAHHAVRGSSDPEKTINRHEGAMRPILPSIIADEPSGTRQTDVLPIVSSQGSTVVDRPSLVVNDTGRIGGERIMTPVAVQDGHCFNNGKSIMRRQNGSTADIPPINHEDPGTHHESTSSVDEVGSDRLRSTVHPADVTHHLPCTATSGQPRTSNRRSEPPRYSSIEAPPLPASSPPIPPSTHHALSNVPHPGGPSRTFWLGFLKGLKKIFCCGME